MRLVIAVLLGFMTFSAGAAWGTTQVTQVDKVLPECWRGRTWDSEWKASAGQRQSGGLSFA